MIKQPWKSQSDSQLFPPPSPALLKDHFRASIAMWMKGTSDEYDDEDSFEDEEDIAEMTETSTPGDRFVT